MKSLTQMTRARAEKTLKTFARTEKKRTKKSLPKTRVHAAKEAMQHGNYHVRRAGWETLGRPIPETVEGCIDLAKSIAPHHLAEVVALVESLGKLFAFAKNYGAYSADYAAAAE